MKQYKNTPYSVTPCGQVFRTGNTLPLKPDIATKTGYQRVTLCVNGITTRKLVHRMVAETFLSKPAGKDFINHIDNNPSNNLLGNLEWCTHSENMLHCHIQKRCSNIIASKKSSELKFKQSETKFKILLGINFVAIENNSPRNFVLYKCAICKVVRKSRADSKVFLNEIILCRNCK